MKNLKTFFASKDTSHPFIHVLLWGIMFAYNLFFESLGREDFVWADACAKIMVPFSFMLVFYANYLCLIDRFLYNKKIWQYTLCNVALVLLLAISLHYWMEYFFQLKPGRKLPFKEKEGLMTLLFISKGCVSLGLSVALSIAIKMTMRWNQIEHVRRELENKQMEAELENLKNQLNPHFLLNTLNNIYALIAFSPQRAQEAVHDLSKLLRYVLYENNVHFVPLEKEIEFIKNYVKLMRIRLSDDVEVQTTFDIQANSRSVIPPLLFISLIENAFKHGVSYTQHSFIDIVIREEKKGKIVCAVKNSYFPKSKEDKSGSGIGLPHLRKRLDLLYAGRYRWEIVQDEKVYTSVITINNTL